MESAEGCGTPSQSTAAATAEQDQPADDTGIEPPQPAAGASRRWVHVARAVISIGLLIQLAVLLRTSWTQYHSGSVSMDFAIFHQAWHQIGAGDLNPFSTIVGYPYLQSHLELAMWPLALVGVVFPSGVTLLVLQDLAIVGAEAIALLWVLDVVRRDRTLRPVHLLPVGTALALFLGSEQIRSAAQSDFHFQPFATLFVLGAARALWRGDTRRVWIWVIAALLTGDVAGTYVAGLGVSALLARRDTRLVGLGLMAAGASWTAGVGLIGANNGSAIAGYAYLVDEPLPASGSALLVVLGALLLHPSRPLAVLRDDFAVFAPQLASTGAIGLLHPWAVGVCAVTVLAGALQESEAFLLAFQNFPLLLFATAGTAMWLDWLSRGATGARGARPPSQGRRVVTAGAVLAVAAVTLLGSADTPPSHSYRPGAAAALEAVDRQLTAQDQVIASFGLVGRFAGREDVRFFLVPAQIPVEAERVVFVFSPTIGNMPTPDAQEAAADAVRDLGARPIVETDDVRAYVWEPPAGTTSITLP